MNIVEEKLAHMCKNARYDAADIMSDMVDKGAIPKEEMYDEAQQHLEEARKNSLGLRHPWLTGIPTLGLWPLAAQEKARRNITARLIAKHPETGQQMLDYEDRMYNLSILKDKANAARNAVGASAVPLAMMASYNARDRN